MCCTPCHPVGNECICQIISLGHILTDGCSQDSLKQKPPHILLLSFSPCLSLLWDFEIISIFAIGLLISTAVLKC